MESTRNLDSGSRGFSGESGLPHSLYYITVLSNLARGYDKYARIYDKSNIPESTYATRFFLVSKYDIQIGIRKASPLLVKLGLPGDRLLAIETHTDADELYPNPLTGLGHFIERSWVVVDAVHFVNDAGTLVQVQIEEACARSLALHRRDEKHYERLIPRSVSVLPVANACQAHCPFCFSKASASTNVQSHRMDWQRVDEVLKQAQGRGASRAVITGGGEPSLLRDEDLDRLISATSRVFAKVVLISNGYKWGSMSEALRAMALRRLDHAGLSVLAISRHHYDSAQNASLMKLNTESEKIADTWFLIRTSLTQLKLRWICVLQRGGIEDRDLLEAYLDWAQESGVEEVCFKELYISTSVESEYFDRAANRWSARNQIPLRIVLDLARDAGWDLVEKLPWGSPIFAGLWRGKHMRVAAYTEPTLFWELTNGTCRSWNLMADGRCLASLEDRHSEVLASGLRKLQTISH